MKGKNTESDGERECVCVRVKKACGRREKAVTLY